jgi:hypothetical protein
MTTAYYVVCRRALPERRGGWTARLGPVDVSEVRRVDHDVVRAAGVGAAAAIVSFCAPPDAAPLSLQLALELARAGAGAVVDEAGPARVADAGADAAAIATADVEAAWDRALAEETQRQRREGEHAQTRWQELRESDPRTDDENDWSDL